MQATRPDACTCGECGVVCHGRFPGCATVWARGPQAVHWKPATVTGPPVPPTGPPTPPERSVPDELGATLRSLVTEVARLRADVDELRDRPAAEPVDLDSLVSRLLVELEPALTGRVRSNPAGSADLPFRAASPEAPADTSAGTERWQDRTA